MIVIFDNLIIRSACYNHHNLNEFPGNMLIAEWFMYTDATFVYE